MPDQRGLLLYVQAEGRGVVPLELDVNASLRELRDELATATGEPLWDLSVGDRVLQMDDDEQQLADLGLCNETTIHAGIVEALQRFRFDSELCCEKLQPENEGSALFRPLLWGPVWGDMSWAACALHPPIPMGVRAQLKLRLGPGGFKSFFTRIGITEKKYVDERIHKRGLQEYRKIESFTQGYKIKSRSGVKFFSGKPWKRGAMSRFSR
eukprot:Hpha_TRINITY_DN11753_c0_g1::TRINITY_DN11753_c0_g1_i1::g.31990::m.31990